MKPEITYPSHKWTGRDPAIDAIKVFLAILVIGIHSTLLTDWIPGSWLLFNQGLYRVAVPTFFVLSGYYLSDRLSQGRWLSRTLSVAKLYLLWMAIYAPEWLRDVWSSDGHLYEIIKTFVIGYWHLWYLSALLICIPLFAVFRSLSSSYLLIGGLGLFAVGQGMQYGFAIMESPLAYKFHYWRNGLFFGLPFMLIGHLIRRHALVARASATLWAVLLMLSLFMLMTEAFVCWYLFDMQGPADLRISLLVAAPALACLGLSIKLPEPVLDQIPLTSASLSSGLYLIHPCLVLGVGRLTQLDGTLATTIVIVVTAALSILVIRLGLHRQIF